MRLCDIRILCDVQITFLGTLYITDKHTCFSAPSDQIFFCLPHKGVKEVRKAVAKTRTPGERPNKAQREHLSGSISVSISILLFLSSHDVRN